jgi:hypothetical protein
MTVSLSFWDLWMCGLQGTTHSSASTTTDTSTGNDFTRLDVHGTTFGGTSTCHFWGIVE